MEGNSKCERSMKNTLKFASDSGAVSYENENRRKNIKQIQKRQQASTQTGVGTESALWRSLSTCWLQ